MKRTISLKFAHYSFWPPRYYTDPDLSQMYRRFRLLSISLPPSGDRAPLQDFVSPVLPNLASSLLSIVRDQRPCQRPMPVMAAESLLIRIAYDGKHGAHLTRLIHPHIMPRVEA